MNSDVCVCFISFTWLGQQGVAFALVPESFQGF